jgi:hypothetical protein
MKHWKYYFFVGGVTLFLIAGVASADTLTDAPGDIYHWKATQTGWAWNMYTGDKPNIDIIELSSTGNATQLVLTMKVDGVIQDSDKIVYWAFYNTSDTTYWMSWTNGQGSGIGMTISNGSGQFDDDPEITVSGDTLTATFDVLIDTTEVAFWGWAAEYTSYQNTTQEWWGDWAPSEYFPFGELPSIDDNVTDDGAGDDETPANGADGNETDANGTDDSTGDGETPTNGADGADTNGTPGFALIAVMVSIVLMVIIRRRKT